MMINELKKLPKQWKIAIIAGIVLLLIIPLAMCGKDAPVDAVPAESDEQQEPIDDVIEEEEVEKKELKYRAQLTNVATEKDVNKRPYAVFIENSPQARPQSGLDKADIVYEVLAEGAITRFIAIYQSQAPEMIGPIRSAREYMLDIAIDYDAYIVHAGGSPGALSRIQREQLPSISEISQGQYFTREKFRKAPHNVYSNLSLLEQGAIARNYRQSYLLPTIPFVADDVETRGQDTKEVVIPYSSGYQVKYIYDEHTKSYHRFINNQPHNDYTTNQQLRAKNVLIAYAKHSVLDKEGRLNINLKTSGKGHVLQNGKSQEVTWRYDNGLMRFYVSGKEVPLYAGNTWIQVVPDVVTVSVQN